MKLSEAIRLGSMMKPQAFGAFTDGRGTCAFGAANEAVGLPVNDVTDERWEALLSTRAKCPVPHCACRRRIVATVVHHLNDDHQVSRERIADFVESIERAQEPREALQALSLVGVGIE